VDIELRKPTPGAELADFVASVSNENGAGLISSITLTNTTTGQVVVGNTDASGQVSLKVLQGRYRLDIKSEGMNLITETIEFQKGKTVLRSFSLQKK
ncbi:MAG: hypothetical protein JWQ35_197, partial [Bacteriovoracaceae bacterium]|nr:hypothetical protein [Bacteriovoracaceae bacterium]